MKDTLSDKPSFKIGLDYISNNVFMGRSPVVTNPIISPDLKYSFYHGLYISASGNYVPNAKKNRFDGGSVAAGYDFDITDDLSGTVSYTKLFYSANSTQIGSAMSSNINANMDYDINDIITPSVSIDYDINRQTINNDIFLNLGLSHDFIFTKIFAAKNFVLISPTAALNAGTQNFYDAYITKKVLKNKKQTKAQNAAVDQFTANVSQFKLLDYELSLPIEYKAGAFIFHFTPEYDILENNFKPTLVTKSLGISKSSTIFYFTTGIAFKF